jgi:hypothetical protein
LSDPGLDVVARSNDLDMYPELGYDSQNFVYEELMVHLGQDSDFDSETGTYLEAVPVTLARFPKDWQSRAIRESIGSVTIGGSLRPVNAIYPEIHDLTVSKVAIRRQKDLEFLEGVVRLGLVDKATLRDRYQQAPRLTQERLIEGLADIDEAFARRENRPS